MSVGSRIQKQRKEMRLSQQDLAHALGVTPQHISLIEKDRRIPSLDFMIRMAHELGVSIDYLVTGKEGLPIDIVTAIKADKILTVKVKKAFITLIEEIRNTQN